MGEQDLLDLDAHDLVSEGTHPLDDRLEVHDLATVGLARLGHLGDARVGDVSGNGVDPSALGAETS